jgi:hypothetical protein
VGDDGRTVAGGQAVEDVVAEGFREAGAGTGLWNINIRNLTLFPPADIDIGRFRVGSLDGMLPLERWATMVGPLRVVKRLKTS